METNTSSNIKMISIIIAAVIIALFIQLPCAYSILNVLSDMDGNHKWINPGIIDFWSFFVMPFTVLGISIRKYKQILKILVISVYHFLNTDEEI